MIVIKNEIRKRRKKIEKFIQFLNDNYDIPHMLSLFVHQEPLLKYGNGNCFGVITWNSNNPSGGKKIIHVTNNIEWFRRFEIEIPKNIADYAILHTIAHEIYHYFQLRDNKEIKENWVDNNAHKICSDYLSIDLKNEYLDLMDKIYMTKKEWRNYKFKTIEE